MRARRPSLGIEILGDRCLPATAYGIPWADPSHLTVSFVPDGVATPYGTNSLFATFGANAPTESWQRDVLRAFQTWAVNANINIGLVADGGQPMGTVGAVQWDGRFGDARIAAAPLSTSLLASAAPFSWSGTTLSGDVVFNNSAPFGIGLDSGWYDVFSLAVHEAGHMFGLEHSTATGSVMSPTYHYQQELSAGDVAALQALYGARTADQYDLSIAGGNDTTGRATPLPSDSLLSSRYLVAGDLTTLADVDYYKFTVPPVTGSLGVSVRLLSAGLSLLAPTVTVYDGAGHVVASAANSDPLHNDLTLRFNASLLGGTYYIKVDGATQDVFGMGAYRLAVDYLSLGTLLVPLAPLLSPVTDGHTDDSLGLPRLLSPTPRPAPDARFDFTFAGVIEDDTDVDRYQIHAPATPGTGPVTLDVIVWSLETNGLDPRVQVYDATTGRPVAFQVLSNDSGIMSLQVPNVDAADDYVVSVLARTPGGEHGTGSYFLAADFNRLPPTRFDGLATDTLNPGGAASDKLTIKIAATYEFALSAEAFAGGSAGVVMTLYDADGRAVLSLTAYAGQPMTTGVGYLAEGKYTVRYTYLSAGSGPDPAVQYSLFLLQLTDGAGPYATSTSCDAEPPPDGSGGYTYNGSSSSEPSGSPYYF